MHNFDWHAKMRTNHLFLILLLLHAKYAFCVHKCLIFSLIFHVYFNLNFTKILGYTCSRTFRSGAKLKAHENGWFVTSLLRLILTFHNPILIPRSVGPFVGSDSTKWYTRIGTSVSPFGMDKPSNHYCSHLNIRGFLPPGILTLHPWLILTFMDTALVGINTPPPFFFLLCFYFCIL